jgi:adenylyltransferase/sulfurtransferase
MSGSQEPTPSEPGEAREEPYAGFQREDLLRYARHFVLPQVGPEGQRALSDSKVLLVGVGGLGSPVALYLTAAGIGTLGVADPDLVDLSNLQRQVLHGISHLGQYKVDSAAARLWELNPNVEVIQHGIRLTSANAKEIIQGYDVVVDGSDNFPARYLVNDACVLLGKPYVYGAVDRWEGQVSVFAMENGPCYRCLFREPPPPGLIPTCAEAGVLGVLPGVIGSLQATEVLKLILGVGVSLAGRLLIFDALDLSFREVGLRPDPNCPVCGDDPTITDLVDYDLFCGVSPEALFPARQPIPQITPKELKSRLEDDPKPFLLDVRERYEWEIGNLEHLGASLVPYGEIPGRLDELPRDVPLVVYCHVGVRSALVVDTLMTRGFTQVLNLSGGYLSWVDEVDPTLTRY